MLNSLTFDFKELEMKILQCYNDNVIRLGILEGDEVYPIDFAGQ